MQRDYGKEIDEIRGQLSEITNLLRGNAKIPPALSAKGVETPHELHQDTLQNDLIEVMRAIVQNRNNTVAMSCSGVFFTERGEMNWVTTLSGLGRFKELLKGNAADKVIACIGNDDRIGILLSLLDAPKTAAQLVEACGYRSTGRIYHLLKPLLAADLVKEDTNQRGVYVVNDKRIPGVMMLLEGIRQLGEDYDEHTTGE